METFEEIADNIDIYGVKAGDNKQLSTSQDNIQSQEGQIESLEADAHSGVEIDSVASNHLSTGPQTKFTVVPVMELQLQDSEIECLSDRTRKLSTREPPAEFIPYMPGAHSPRKLSFVSHSHSQPSSRKSSFEALLYNPRRTRQSVFSILSHESGESTRTFGDTIEAFPHVDNYRDLQQLYSVLNVRQRPTLFELREDKAVHASRNPTRFKENLFEDELEDSGNEEDGKKESIVKSAPKFGWIQGVLIRCLLNIFGVMLFLRLTWVTGQAGVGLASIVVLLSAIVTVITTLSMSAICTNGEVKGGGAYYMISRSLGAEFGGSIGIVFSLANAVAAAMYVVGFSETVRDIMWEYGSQITGDSLNEVRIIGCVTSVVILGIVVIGLEWEAKAQIILLAILVAAIFNYFIGTFIPPSEEQKWKGMLGYSSDVFSENFGPDFRDGESFFSVFSVFFPAATGILAGANISGDLKDPQSAIPKGTLLAILITTIIYIVMAWTAGGCIIRDAVGPISNFLVSNVTVASIHMSAQKSHDLITDCEAFNTSCKYGLHNYNGMVGIASAFRPLILAGIFSATLSSALASMIGAPKIFQALGKDKLFPFIEYFSKGYGHGGEPRRGYILAFVICVGMTCVGSLNVIAPIISNFFLMAYALINYSCFDANIVNTPGYRPGFQYYNKWFSLLGAVMCLAIMFLIQWWAALVTFLVVGGLYLYIRAKKPEVNWGSSPQAHAYKDALQATIKLITVDEHVKNFRPQILVLSGYPRNRPVLIDFVASITRKQSLLMCGHVFRGVMSGHVKNLRSMTAYMWFKKRDIRAFYNSVTAPTLRIGAQVLMQALGIGKLRPNTLIIGYKDDWQKSDPTEVEDYFDIIQDAFDLHFGVGILRIPESLNRNKVMDEYMDDASEVVEFDDEMEYDEEMESVEDDQLFVEDETSTQHTCKQKAEEENKPLPECSYIPLKRLNTLPEGIENIAFENEQESETRKKEASDDTNQTNGCNNSVENDISMANSTQLPRTCTFNSTEEDTTTKRFQTKQQGTLDVWWLFDDGGLTLLIPYILSTRKQWKDCKLRVFCAGTKKCNVEEEQMRMASLLNKFRIKYSKLTVIPDLRKKPSLSAYKEFESTIRPWRLRPGEFLEMYPHKITDTDLIAQKQKTYRHIRLRELLQQYSKEAALVVMTLPMPKKNGCPPGLYMTWLEMLTRDMPPILLLRGNQQSVLTYYT